MIYYDDAGYELLQAGQELRHFGDNANGPCPHCRIQPFGHEVDFTDNTLQVFLITNYEIGSIMCTPAMWWTGYHDNPPLSHCIYKAHLDRAIAQAGPDWVVELHLLETPDRPMYLEPWERRTIEWNDYRSIVQDNCRHRRHPTLPLPMTPTATVLGALIYDIAPRGNNGHPFCWMLETSKYVSTTTTLQKLVDDGEEKEIDCVWKTTFNCVTLKTRPAIILGLFVKNKLKHDPLSLNDHYSYSFITLKPRIPVLPFCIPQPDATFSREVQLTNQEFEPGALIIGFLLVLNKDKYRVVSLCRPCTADLDGNAVVEINTNTDNDINTLPTTNCAGYYGYNIPATAITFYPFSFLYPADHESH
jgi:hypothetical protein